MYTSRIAMSPVQVKILFTLSRARSLLFVPRLGSRSPNRYAIQVPAKPAHSSKHVLLNGESPRVSAIAYQMQRMEDLK